MSMLINLPSKHLFILTARALCVVRRVMGFERLDHPIVTTLKCDANEKHIKFKYSHKPNEKLVLENE